MNYIKFVVLHALTLHALLLHTYDIKNDAAALRFVEQHANVFICVSFPCTKVDELVIESILDAYGDIHYKKHVELTYNGSVNFVYACYKHDHSMQELQKLYPSIFPNKGGVIVAYVYSCDDLETMRKVKSEIRKIYKVKCSIHATDDHSQSLDLARYLFLDNGIHFLNNRNINNFNNFKTFNELFLQFKKLIKGKESLFVLDSSATLAVYGLRDCRDLDYLSINNIKVEKHPKIENHKSELIYHKKSGEELINDTRNFFWVDGVKFVSLQQLYLMKKNRFNVDKNNKDEADLKLMAPLLQTRTIDEEPHIIHMRIDDISSSVNKAAPIYAIDVSDITLDNEGYFTEESLRHFLEKAYKNKYLSDQYFKKVTCIKITDIFHEFHGDSTNQLFFIQSECKENIGQGYILKELMYGETPANIMAKAYDIAALRPFINNKIENYPVLIVPFVYFSYSYLGKTHILALMKKAPGITLKQLMKRYIRNTLIDAALIKYYTKIGSATGKFHSLFLREHNGILTSVLHSDFNIGNVMYDEITDTVSFIDNECISIVYNKRENIVQDIARLLAGPVSLSDALIEEKYKGNWFYLTFKSFLQGYLPYFPDQTMKEKIVQQVKEKLSKSNGCKKIYARYKRWIDAALDEISAFYGLKSNF